MLELSISPPREFPPLPNPGTEMMVDSDDDHNGNSIYEAPSVFQAQVLVY